jgi:hypothetical protein
LFPPFAKVEDVLRVSGVGSSVFAVTVCGGGFVPATPVKTRPYVEIHEGSNELGENATNATGNTWGELPA